MSKRNIIFVATTAVIVIVIALTIYYMVSAHQAEEYRQQYGYCGTVLVKQAKTDLNKIWARWEDADKIASSTPRGSLSPQIASLQSIRRDEFTIAVPDCMISVRLDYFNGMGSAIDGYIAFMGQDAITQESTFKNAAASFRKATDRLSLVSVCAPDCKE